MPLFTERIIQPPAAFADLTHKPQWAGKVAEVFPGSPADMAGILPDDLISAVNGHQVQDVIDVQFYAAEPECILTVHRGEETLSIPLQKDVDQQIGVQFEDDLFDGIRLCANRCDFCFVDQQPTGMRQTLNIRDDDFRLSFLHGNFVTLTNMSDYDWWRVFNQKLSPLYVSVHATDETVRRRLLRNKNAVPVLDEIQRLIDGGIQVHTQIVLCQGMNDGDVLEKSITDLAALYPSVQTLAVVPMGVTDYRLERNESEPFDQAGCRKALDQVRPWQRKFESSHSTRFVTPSDEFYLVAGRPLPKAYTYEGFPQLSNGVGGSRLFLDELQACVKKYPRSQFNGRVQLVTGALSTSLIQQLADAIMQILGLEAQVVPAINNWYGPSTTVTGLLTGRDVTDALNKAGFADVVLVPDIMLRENTEIFLDDKTIRGVSQDVRKPLLAVKPWPLPALDALTEYFSRTAA